MALKMHTARVRLQCTIEIDAGGTYGPDWKLGDMMAQAKGDAITMLNNTLRAHDIRVLGEPQLTAALFPEK